MKITILTHILSASESSAYFYGWEYFSYMRYMIKAYLKQFPWQVQISFIIIGLSILTIILLFLLFSKHVIDQQSRKRAYSRCTEKYETAFRHILQSPEKLSIEEIEYLCKSDRSEFQSYDVQSLQQLILKIRLEMSDLVYVPNMQRLCSLTGVRDALENDLIKGHNVEQTLQILMTLPIRVSEGALAVYTNSKNDQIRELARAYFGFCSKSEPFSFVTQDINESFKLWYPTVFHRLCGWHRAKGHPIPQLLSMARRSRNDDKKALFISEIPYWGSEEEKQSIKEFLTPAVPKCCSAAIRALSLIGDPDSEAELIKNYNLLFPTAKRETLRAVAHINTGRQTQFFKDAYTHSTSHKTRAVALSCLFNYGQDGRAAFYELSRSGLDNQTFFEQIVADEEHMQTN